MTLSGSENLRNCEGPHSDTFSDTLGLGRAFQLQAFGLRVFARGFSQGNPSWLHASGNGRA